MTLTLIRFCSAPFGTFGYLDIAGVRLYTVERPWLDNERNVSCIPPGHYRCAPRRFFRGGYDAIEVLDVPDRTHILFHKANLPRHVEGCIGVGAQLGCLGGEWAVLRSAEGFGELMLRTRDVPTFNLVIT